MAGSDRVGTRASAGAAGPVERGGSGSPVASAPPASPAATGPRITGPRSLVDYAASLDCIHCGLCLHTCPTYRLTGVESSSPRGRIHLMRGVAEGRIEADAEYAEEMDFCLVCRNCESVCPAGVRFGEMMEWTRDELGKQRPRGALVRLARRIGFARLLPSRRFLRLAASALGLLQRLHLARPLGRLLGARGRGLADLPPVPPRAERRPLPERTPAAGDVPRGAAAMLEGCVMPELFGRVNRATALSLSRLGFEVRVPPAAPPATRATCCGSLHAHNGELGLARDLARRTIAAFDALVDEHGAPLEVVVNSSGCGSHMKEYAHLLAEDPAWAERARAFAARVRDYAEFLAPVVAGEAPAAASGLSVEGLLPSEVAWDDPCHLCHGQGIRAQPRAVLDAIAGIERIELEDSESCCGSAGLYSLLRPDDSTAILAERLSALRTSGARVLVTANPGCQLQWETGIRREGLGVRVLHLAELVALATRRDREWRR